MTSQKRRAELLGKALDILIDEPEGLPATKVFERISHSNGLSQEELSARPSHSRRLFEELIWLGTIAPSKAGWLQNDPECWRFTESGKRAYQSCTSPEAFSNRAANRSPQGWMSVHFPETYSVITKTADRLLVESKFLRRIGPRELLVRAFGRTQSWEEVLPLQTPQHYVIPATLSDTNHLLEHLNSTGADFFQGGHAIYLSPSALKKSAFSVIAWNYPDDAGLKIVSTPGGISEGGYVREGYGNGRGESILHKKMVYDHRRLTLVANLMFSHGLGPRLYDLVEIQAGDSRWVGYVVEHIEGHTPSMTECAHGVAQMRALEDSGLILNNMAEGWNEEDFRCPTCNGNAIVDEAGEFHYVDFQNFVLTGYEDYLRDVAVEATEKSHFGETSLLRGGRAYLYQSVPGVNLPAKRSPERRIKVLSELIKSSGVSLEGRLVLDVGCNIGGMMAQYLKLGARWCHGWDRDYVTPHTERLLLALGCTRFSMTGGDIDKEKDLKADLPSFLRPSLDGCAISYLAVRGHLGWLKALGTVPWSFLIYEGHEADSKVAFEKHMNELRNLTDFKVAAATTYADGDSDERIVAILVRTRD